MKATRFLIFILVFVALTLTIAHPAIAQTPTPGQDTQPTSQVPEAVMLLISAGAGGLCVKIVNFLKDKLGWTKDTDKTKNVWLTFGTAGAMAVILLLITNSFVPLSGPDALVTGATLAFTVATLLYKSMQPTTPEINPPTA